MTGPLHHPGEDLLLEYASGAMAEPLALLVATHLTLCPACRAEADRLEALGGAMLQDIGAEPVSSGLLDRVLDCLDDAGPDAEAAVARETRPVATGAPFLVPAPLHPYLGDGFGKLPWRTMMGLKEVELLKDRPGFTTRLMRITPGAVMPRHTHEGAEMTLVLSGGFTDRGNHFVRGDVAIAGPSDDHQPVADSDGECVCLAVTSAPLRLTGPIGRYLNPFIRI
ncbi:MAG: ChrR family anti-sigma-E factor [Alphaproteobacteria bacterium]|nr:ChrR family anti-sigma-E factor [Alphaproteobacteria bacterium]MDX5370481.1 ChrR family anti-sigma-E factor [Alphaproteobacteria bacterium]MDX5464987.1 ChrR family anti-sigma-E factor [Alphaproteobacteria bacterium]